MEEEIARIRKLAKEMKILYSPHERNRSLERGVTQKEARLAVMSGYIYEYGFGYESFTAVGRVAGKYIRVGVELKKDYLVFSTVMELEPGSSEAKLCRRWLRSKRA
jgi:hypothetical protein